MGESYNDSLYTIKSVCNKSVLLYMFKISIIKIFLKKSQRKESWQHLLISRTTGKLGDSLKK